MLEAAAFALVCSSAIEITSQMLALTWGRPLFRIAMRCRSTLAFLLKGARKQELAVTLRQLRPRAMFHPEAK